MIAVTGRGEHTVLDLRLIPQILSTDRDLFHFLEEGAESFPSRESLQRRAEKEKLRGSHQVGRRRNSH